jgi:hypothetical protein
MVLLYGRARRLTAKNGGSWPGQSQVEGWHETIGQVGLCRIVALHCRSSTSYQIFEEIRCLSF